MGIDEGTPVIHFPSTGWARRGRERLDGSYCVIRGWVLFWKELLLQTLTEAEVPGSRLSAAYISLFIIEETKNIDVPLPSRTREDEEGLCSGVLPAVQSSEVKDPPRPEEKIPLLKIH